MPVAATLARPRGRAAIAASPAARPAGGTARMVALLLLLPMFGEVFQLTSDIYPLYALSKIWPFLMTPLTLIGCVLIRLPARLLYVVTLAYMVSFSPLMAMLQLGSSFIEAMTTVVKIMPLSSFFSLSLILAWLRPTAAELERAITWLGYTTFVLLALLWEVVPLSSYRSEFGLPSIFIANDDVRGDRIIMPMFFGLMLLFQLARRFARDHRVRHLLLILVGYWLLATIYKERVPIVVSFGVICIAYLETVIGSRRVAMLVSVSLGLGAITLALGIVGIDAVVEQLGGSLAVRLMSIDIAWDFIRDDPLRLVFGTGGTTTYTRLSLNVLFRNPAFYLADIGWLGVVFEYGLIGALLIASVDVAGVLITRRLARPGATLSLALADYAFYLLPASLIYSAVLLPGEIATVTALAVYLRMASGTDPSTRPRSLV